MNVSLVIPAHNERGNLARLLDLCDHELSAAGGGEVVLIDDGSSDGSAEYLSERAATDPRLRVLSHPPGGNIGCHPSELEGLRACSGDVALFLPADLQIRPDVLPQFLAAHAAGANIVVGWRRDRADGLARRLLSTANNLVERAILRIDLHDTHSAMSLDRRALDEVANLVTSTSALIPAEILIRARLASLTIREIEIAHFPREAGRQTGAALGGIMRVQLDLLRLRGRIRREQRSASQPDAAETPSERSA